MDEKTTEATRMMLDALTFLVNIDLRRLHGGNCVDALKARCRARAAISAFCEAMRTEVA